MNLKSEQPRKPLSRRLQHEAHSGRARRGRHTRRLKIGIVCDEFFHQDIGGFGGFGWLAREIACLFNEHPELGTEVVFLAAHAPPESGAADEYHGIRVIFKTPDRLKMLSAIARERIDILFSVDYRESYRFAFKSLPRTPVVFWIQDPRPLSDVEKVRTLRVPANEAVPEADEPRLGRDQPRIARPDVVASDALPFECDMRSVFESSARWRRTIIPAISAPSLASKAAPTYQAPLTPPFAYLPYTVDVPERTQSRAPKPRVVFLGRLDPVKRPWVFAAIAREMPEADFVFLGVARETGPGAWMPNDLPANLRLAGHLEGEAKARELSSAWILVNTSIHEALPVSFIEGLAYELPIVSCQDPEELATHFGRFVSRWDGNGLDAVPSYCRSIRELLASDEERATLGRAGREWALEHHGRRHFLAGLASIATQLGIGAPKIQAWVR